MIKQGRLKNDIVFEVINGLIMMLVVVVTVYPFLNIIALSFSKTTTIGLSLLPKEFTLINYTRVIENNLIWVGLQNTIIRVIVGTSLTLIVMIMFAYTLSKKDLPGRVFLTLFIVFTMFFDGGLIPRYILIKNLHLMNTMWALVLPRLIDTFALIVMRNYMMSLPDSLEESAKIDGASYFRILFSIIAPISMPIIATVILWTAVWHWNAWFDVLLYIKDYDKMVLQYVLRRIVIEGASDTMNVMMESVNEIVPAESIKAAAIIFSTIPILIVYPFLQKYFVKGIMVGSLKG
ncbi:MAG: carbohydrate ABC transporter permease [Firmicutes bacterium]|nr:carbohydrate ABC transporter permease [Bacillota bacterium]